MYLRPFQHERERAPRQAALDHGQRVWNECSRLIANAIIDYNTLLLSRVYEQKLAADDQEAIKILRGISPVAWRDVNFETLEP